MPQAEGGDEVVCFNFRNDRVRQISAAFALADFADFDRGDGFDGSDGLELDGFLDLGEVAGDQRHCLGLRHRRGARTGHSRVAAIPLNPRTGRLHPSADSIRSTAEGSAKEHPMQIDPNNTWRLVEERLERESDPKVRRNLELVLAGSVADGLDGGDRGLVDRDQVAVEVDRSWSWSGQTD